MEDKSRDEFGRLDRGKAVIASESLEANVIRQH